MTFRQLQEYLDAVKWEDSVARSCDMCGRYARCRYCVRTEEYPCAMAHNRLVAATNAPVPDHVPDWLLPEPDVEAKFGALTATEETALSVSAPAALAVKAPAPLVAQPARAAAPSKDSVSEPEKAGTMSEEEGEKAPSMGTMSEAEPVEGENSGRPRPHVLVRGTKGNMRLCTLSRRLPTVSSELGGEGE